MAPRVVKKDWPWKIKCPWCGAEALGPDTPVCKPGCRLDANVEVG